MRGAATFVVLAARDQGLDPDWPPVLVALVLVVLGALVASAVVVYRALRADARGSNRRRRGRAHR